MKDEYICYRTKCRYHSGDVSGCRGSCNYFFITGETKTSRGEADITRKCGLYKPGTAPRVRAQPVVLPGSRPQKKEPKPQTEDRRRIRAGRKYDWTQFRALWEEGKNDREIAREIGCNADTVQKWRHGAGLPPRYRQEIDRARLKELWEAGMDDPQIAERLGVSRQSVYKTRKKLELPTHNPRMSHGKVKK